MKKTVFTVSLIIVFMLTLASCGEDKTPYFADGAALAGTVWSHNGAPDFLIALNTAFTNYPDTLPVSIVMGPGGTWALQALAEGLGLGLPTGTVMSVAGGTYEVYNDGVMFTVAEPPMAATMGMGALPAGFKNATTLKLTEVVGGIEFTKAATVPTPPNFADAAALAGTKWTHLGAPVFLLAETPALAAYPDQAPVDIEFSVGGTWQLKLLATLLPGGSAAPWGTMAVAAGGTFELMGDVVLLSIQGTTTQIPAAFTDATTLELSALAGGTEFTKDLAITPAYADTAALVNKTFRRTGMPQFLKDAGFSSYPDSLAVDIVFGSTTGMWELQIDSMAVGGSTPGTMVSVPGAAGGPVGGQIFISGNAVLLATASAAFPGGFSAANTLWLLTPAAGGGSFTLVP